VLVIDAANVIGSRPDGWWKDLPGAAERLHRALVRAELPYELMVMVLEGRAQPGVPEGEQGTVRTIHARGAGDDAVVEACESYAESEAEITLATADRGLISRVKLFDLEVLGPRTLRDEIGM
jgi:hypothetical protein